jgi:hypothetical protein
VVCSSVDKESTREARGLGFESHALQERSPRIYTIF